MFNNINTKSEYTVTTYQVTYEDFDIPDVKTLTSLQIKFFLEMWLKLTTSETIETELLDLSLNSSGAEFTVRYNRAYSPILLTED